MRTEIVDIDFLALEKKAALEGNDIHKQTAIELFGECTSVEQRRFAKAMNFNLIYGGRVNVTGCITGRYHAKDTN